MEARGVVCCDRPNLVPSKGFVCCTSCGSCIEPTIEGDAIEAQLPRLFEGDEALSHNEVSTHYTRTVMAVSDLRQYPKYKPLNKYNYWYSKESRFYNHGKTFKHVAGKVLLPNHVKEEAASIYRRMWSAKLFRNHDTHAISLSCLYYGCEIHKHPITIQYFLSEDLWLDREGNPPDKRSSPLMTKLSAAMSLVHKFLSGKKLHKATVPELIVPMANGLSLPTAVVHSAVALYKDARKNGFDPSGKARLAMAGAAIYICSTYHDCKILQAAVCVAAKTTEITLRSRIGELLETSTLPAATNYKHASKSRKHAIPQKESNQTTQVSAPFLFSVN